MMAVLLRTGVTTTATAVQPKQCLALQKYFFYFFFSNSDSCNIALCSHIFEWMDCQGVPTVWCIDIDYLLCLVMSGISRILGGNRPIWRRQISQAKQFGPQLGRPKRWVVQIGGTWGHSDIGLSTRISRKIIGRKWRAPICWWKVNHRQNVKYWVSLSKILSPLGPWSTQICWWNVNHRAKKWKIGWVASAPKPRPHPASAVSLAQI